MEPPIHSVCLSALRRRCREGTHNRESFLVDFSGELKVNTTEDRTHVSMDLHRPSDLGDDINEMTSLEGRIGLGRFGISVLMISPERGPDDLPWHHTATQRHGLWL